MADSPILRRLLALLLAPLLLAACQTTPGPSATYEVSDMEIPRVAAEASGDSFWRDRVVYPFPVDYATVTDDRGTAYEIAYMDEYRGEDRDSAEVLVLVHGKGTSAGGFSRLMRDALESGLRVIAFDLPHYGKSLPGNLDPDTYTRTLQDTREAGRELLVEHLGVDSATLLGHSMGGQWAIGYALAWPEDVERLILEAPAGLEEYPRTLNLPSGELPWMDPSYKYDLDRWREVWEPLGRLERERAQTAQEIRDFYYFRERDPETGETRAADTGFFLEDTVDAQFLTETRVGMIDGLEDEYRAWTLAFVRDIYTMGIEVNREDPGSLVKRLDALRVPVFIAFGEADPLIPTTAASGNEDLRWDVIRPAYERLSQAGAEPVVKLYDGAGHFVHVDAAEAFNQDVIRFTYGESIPGTDEPADYDKPAVDLPDDVEAFLESDRQAVLSGDMEAVMAHYHPDYLDQGRSRGDQRDMLARVLPVLSRYQVELTGFERDGDRAVVEGVVRTSFGSQALPEGAMMIREDGEWLWYGNQR